MDSELAAKDSMPRSSSRLLALLLAGQAAFATFWMWIMPGGFDWLHPRFAANRLLPCALVVVTLAAFVARRRARPEPFEVLACAMPPAWLALAVAWRVVFPLSGFRAPLLAFVVALGWSFFVWRAGVWRGRPLAPRIAGACLAAAASVTLTFTQHAPLPDTRPLGERPPSLAATDSNGAEVPHGWIDLSPTVRVDAFAGQVSVRCDRMTIDVSPLLQFISRSPDRGWTLFATRKARVGVPLRPTFYRAREGVVDLAYRGSESAELRVSSIGDSASEGTRSAGAEIEAWTTLAQPVYSHLNSYCELSVSDYRKLELAFSPCADARIEVMPSDYPTGRAARLAYVDESDMFHVVEASSGEKGPFRELAAGRLSTSEPLEITLFDAGNAVARVTLFDWSRQAGRAISPTAGWGLPVNAIEFSEVDDGLAMAQLWITLAGTSVGRGWDSVGHTAGVYRNRVEVESLNSPSP